MKNDNEIWVNPELWKMWSWMLCKANHGDDKFVLFRTGRGNTQIKVSRGQFVFGRNTAADELNVSPSTVWKRLKKFKELGFSDMLSNKVCTIVTICNYEELLCSYESRVTSDWHSKVIAKDTKKNYKNYKNYKNLKEPPYIPPVGETKNNKRETVSSTKRKTQIPEDYSPSPAILEWAAKQGYENIPDQVGAFVDFHRSKGNVFLQADLAFKTWLRNSGRFPQRGGIARKNNKYNNDKLDEFLEGEK